jgi:hypothetical protein
MVTLIELGGKKWQEVFKAKGATSDVINQNYHLPS